MGQGQAEIITMFRSPLEEVEMSLSVLLEGEACAAGKTATLNCMGLLQQMFLLSRRHSKKIPLETTLEITREGWWSSKNTFADRVVPSLQCFKNGNLLSLKPVGEKPVASA